MRSLFLSICIGLMACSSDDEVIDQQPSNSVVLFNCWTHSMEEDPDSNIQIFRPCDFMDFPIARFRLTMTLRSDGSAEYLELAPNDAHELVDGSWTYSESDNTFQLLNEKEDAVLSGTVNELGEDLLAISR